MDNSFLCYIDMIRLDKLEHLQTRDFAPLKNGSIRISVSRPTTQQAGNNELFGQSETPTLSG